MEHAHTLRDDKVSTFIVINTQLLIFFSYVQANKIGKINLAATGKDLMDDEKQGDVTVDLFAALEMQSEAVTERSSELENSQTLGLLLGFLFVDDW